MGVENKFVEDKTLEGNLFGRWVKIVLDVAGIGSFIKDFPFTDMTINHNNISSEQSIENKIEIIYTELENITIFA